MYQQDMALNNLQGLICHKTQPTNQPVSVPSMGQIELSHHLLYLNPFNCM